MHDRERRPVNARPVPFKQLAQRIKVFVLQTLNKRSVRWPVISVEHKGLRH